MAFINFGFSLFVFLGLLFTPAAQAEYRVFLLRIMERPLAQEENKASSPSTPETLPPAAPTPSDLNAGRPSGEAKPPDTVVREFPSTLDPLQYPTYYPLGPNQYVVYVDTWRCRGRTNNKSLCPNPKPPAEETPP